MYDIYYRGHTSSRYSLFFVKDSKHVSISYFTFDEPLIDNTWEPGSELRTGYTSFSDWLTHEPNATILMSVDKLPNRINSSDYPELHI